MKRIAFLCAAGLGVAIPACGSLDSNTGSAPALATLSGSLSNPSPQSLSVTGSVRVAVVWRKGTQGQFSVAQDLAVQPVFPSSFTIDLDRPPPAEAMTITFAVQPPGPNTAGGTGEPPGPGTTVGGPGAAVGGLGGVAGTALTVDGGVGVVPGAGDGGAAAPAPPPLDPAHLPPNAFELAIGTVVAYVDRNGNGKLDLVPEDASAYIDQIVASNSDLAIVYIQGPLPASTGVPSFWNPMGLHPSEGYNLLRVLPPCVPEALTRGYTGNGNVACTSDPPPEAGAPPPMIDAGACEAASRWLPITAPYPLVVASTPEVASVMCQSSGGSGELSSSSGDPPSNPSVGATGGGVDGPFDPSVQPAQYPDPCDPNLSCSGDGSEYLFATCTKVSQGICAGTIDECTSAGYARPTPVPAAWPCVH